MYLYYIYVGTFQMYLYFIALLTNVLGPMPAFGFMHLHKMPYNKLH